MSVNLEGLSGELFHSAGAPAAGEIGGHASATEFTLYGPKFIGSELVYDYITDPEPVPATRPTTASS